MAQIAERRKLDWDWPMVAFGALAMGGFMLAAVLLSELPDPFAARVVACASSLALLVAAIRVPYPGLARTLVRSYAGAVAAVFAVASLLGR